jgi:hypothetical protein
MTDNNYEEFLWEDIEVFSFPVLWHEWECHGTAWIMQRKDGTRYLKGGGFENDFKDLLERIYYYESVIQKTKLALEYLNENKETNK